MTKICSKYRGYRGTGLKNRTCLLAFSLLLAAFWQPLYACSTITLVSSNSHFGMVHRIEADLYSHPHLHPKLAHITADTVKDASFFKQTDTCLIVTVGAEAFATVLKTQAKIPVLGVLIRKNIFYSILKEHNRNPEDMNAPVTAIYLDQPLQRQLNLLQCLLPKNDPRHVGVLLGSYSLAEQNDLQALARKSNVKFTLTYVNKFENPVAVLDALLDEVKAVLAIPDNQIYNPKTARGILLTAFHKRIPIVGYSRTYVNNGALAAVYSTTKQFAHQAAEQILHLVENKNNKYSPPQYPKEYTIAVNYQVARTLGLSIESEATLKQAMDKLELTQKKDGMNRGE